MSEEPIKVLFPARINSNPYHDLLFEGLEQHGVEPIQESQPIFLPLTRSLLRNRDLDVIHLEWFFQPLAVRNFTPSRILNTIITIGRSIWFCIDLLIVRLLGVQIVWTVHNKYNHEGYYPRVEQFLRVIVAKIVHSITVKCDSAKEIISDLYRVQNDSKITVVPDGNYINAYPNEIGKDEARVNLDIGNEFVYLYFGLIRPYKGVNQLIEVFQSIKEKNSELWIVGNPKDRAVEQQIRSHVSQNDQIHARLEYIPDEDVQYYMNAADVLVLPFQDILNSGSVHLGLTFGNPIIAPKIGCIPELVPPENNLLYDPQEIDGLKKSLVSSREADLIDIGKKNFEHISYFDWETIGLKYLEIYQNNA